MTIQDENPMKLNPTKRIAINANNIPQPWFHKTEKKRGRPRKTQLKRPTVEDMKKLLRFIIFFLNVLINNRMILLWLNDHRRFTDKYLKYMLTMEKYIREYITYMYCKT